MVYAYDGFHFSEVGLAVLNATDVYYSFIDFLLFYELITLTDTF